MNYARPLVISLLIYLCSSLVIAAGNPPIKIYETKAEFSDIRENLINAIINRGYVLDFNGRVGDMLKRTRDDVGGKHLYRNAEYMAFCSAVLSRIMMEADIRNMGYCPYVVIVYESRANPGTISVGYRNLATSENMDPTLIEVDKILDQIAREAVE